MFLEIKNKKGKLKRPISCHVDVGAADSNISRSRFASTSIPSAPVIALTGQDTKEILKVAVIVISAHDRNKRES